MGVLLKGADGAPSAGDVTIPIGASSRESMLAPNAASDFKALKMPSSPIASPHVESAGTMHLASVASASLSLNQTTAAAPADDESLRQARDKAYQEAYAAGSKAGEAAAREEWRKKLDALSVLATALRADRQGLIESAIDTVIESAYAAAVRVIGESVATEQGIVAAVQQILKAIKQEQAATAIRISAADWDYLGEDGRSRLAAVAEAGVKVIKDPGVKTGGCILDLERGSLDGRLEVQLARLKSVFIEARARLEQPE